MRFAKVPNPLGPIAVSGLVLTLAAAASVQANWQGQEVDKDGVTHVMNPAIGMSEDRTLGQKLLWEVTADEQEVLIGRVAEIVADDEGNSYVLDNQLSEVHVFSPEGEYIRSIGREGEGPGEFRMPMNMFLLKDGSVGVVQMSPGKLAMMDKEGTPLGDLELPVGEGGSPPMLLNAGSGGDNIVVQLTEHGFDGTTVRTKNSLLSLARDGSVLGAYFTDETEQKMESSGGGISITMDSSAMGEWSAGPNGTVFRSPHRNQYLIEQFAADGTLERIIEREFESRKRTEEELEEIRKQNESMRERFGGGPSRPAETTNRDIAELHPRADGSLWVLTSYGDNDNPENTMGVFDVFDPQGRYEGQVTVPAQYDPDDDRLFLRGNRLYIVRNGLDAMRSGGGGMMIVVGPGGGEEDDDDEPAELSIECYELTN